MGFSLKRFLDEATAQVNPFDGGKTAQTVRNARQAPPAQTIRRPVGQPPRQSIFNKVRDQFDANTEADNYRRAQQFQLNDQPTENLMRETLRKARVGLTDPNVAAAKLRSMGTSSSVEANTAKNVLEPPRAIQVPGQQVINAVTNRKVAPIAMGIGRSGAGTAEGFSGLYDLATPGKGQNRFGKMAQRAGEITDQVVKDEQYNPIAYKAGQAGGDVATFMASGAPITKAVGATTGLVSKAPLIGKAVSSIDKAADAGNLVAKSARYLARPDVTSDIIADTALSAGLRSNRGGVVTPTTMLVDAGTSLGMGGALGVTGYGVKQGIKGVRKAAPIVADTASDIGRRVERFNPEVAQIDKTISLQENAMRNAPSESVAARHAKVIDDLIRQRAEILQGGYVKNPFGKDIADGLSKEQSDFINQYANMLEDMGSGNGVDINPETGARMSNNFRTADIQGKNMSKADWFDKARQDLESGKGAYGASDEYKKLPAATTSTAKPQGFIIKETKPRNGRQDTIRVKAQDGKLVSTTQTENVPGYDPQDVGSMLKQADMESPSPQRPPQEPTAPSTPPTKADRKQQSKDFMAITNEYLGKEKSGQIGASDVARKYNEQFGGLSKDQKLEAIMVLDGMKTTKDKQVQAAVDALSKQYDEAYGYFTKDKGIKMGYRQEYSPRIYKDANGNLLNAQEYKLLQRGSGRQKGREAADLNPDALVTKDPAELLQKYYTGLERASAGKQYIKQLEESGMVMTADGTPPRGMKPVVAEGMLADGQIYYARPEIADKLNKMFGSQEASGFFEKSLEKAQGFNSFMQSFVLSGGIPNTPINAFGIMQLMKNGMALHPIQGAKAFLTGMSRDNATKFFDNHAEYVKKAAENGLDIRYDTSLTPNSGRQRIASAKEKGTGAVVNQAWNELTNDATFGRFMPALETLHFKGVYDGLIRKGVEPKQAAKQAAGATSNFFGKNSMAKDATKSKVGSNAAGAFLFAPRFRESMLNFWVKNAHALNPKNMGKIEYRDNIKFMAAAAATYAAMEGANKALTGEWMHDNPDGKKDKLLIPGGELTGGKYIGIPFLPSVATVPRNAVMGAYNLATGNLKEAGKNVTSFASMPLRTLLELGTNENYFGSRIVDENASTPEKIAQAGSYVATNNMQPWIREGLNAAGQNLPDGVKKSLNIKNQSGFETASKALEAPLRFYDPGYFKGGKTKEMAQKDSNIGTRTKTTKDDSKSIINAAFNSPEGKKFMALDDEGKKAYAQESPENRAMYNQYQAMKKSLNGGDKLLATDLDEDSAKTLQKFDKLTPKAKERLLYRDNAAEYEYELANYKNKVANGELSTTDEINAQEQLSKLKVGKDFKKDIRDLHSLDKSDLYEYLSTETTGVDKAKLAKDILAYDDALTKAGVQSKNKFRDKYGREAIKPRESGSGGRGGSKLASKSILDVFPDGLAPGQANNKLREILKKATLS